MMKRLLSARIVNLPLFSIIKDFVYLKYYLLVKQIKLIRLLPTQEVKESLPLFKLSNSLKIAQMINIIGGEDVSLLELNA